MAKKALAKIKGYDNYIVSKDGKVYSLRELIPYKNNKGYLRVKLTNEDGKQKNELIHRLVFSNLGHDIPGGYVINHKDCNKKNNALSNLEFMTQLENIIYRDKMREIRNKNF